MSCPIGEGLLEAREPASHGSLASTQFVREDAKRDAPLEWWFLQGRYATDDASGNREFMVSLFRMNLNTRSGGERNGFKLLLTVLDPAHASRHETVTWMDKPSYERLIAEIDSTDNGLDPAVQQALLDELREHGPPGPVEIKDTPDFFSATPLTIVWDDFLLRQTQTAFVLEFQEPGSGARIHLECEPTADPVNIDCDVELTRSGAGMHYRSVPRLIARGERDGAALNGEAWMDHQWGQWDWLRDPRNGALLGWEWFGINLSDGSDWVLLLRRDVRSGEPVATHVTTRTASGDVRVSSQLKLTPLRHWESPATHIVHPVAWAIAVPEFGAEFRFEPLCDAQEVYALGPSRGFWEGAGRVSGAIDGVAVTGVARGEFCGYGYVLDYQAFLHQMGRRVDRCLEEFLPRQIDLERVEKYVGAAVWRHEPEAYTQTIARPAWDLINRSGKRWRPIFGILLLEALGVNSRQWEALIATMTELIHTACLIVDDIEDGSVLRRGEQCLHLRYGVDVALNAANTLYFLPAVALFEHPLLTNEKRARLHEIKERVLIEAHCGQASDIYWSRELGRDQLERWLDSGFEEKVLQMYAFKTGAGAKGLADFATAIADATPAVRAAAAEFSRTFAVAFQIVDDVLNFSRSDRWRKTCGEDLVNGKPTYVIAHSLRMLDTAGRDRLAEILCSADLRRQPPAIEEGIGLIEGSGALEACRTEARTMTEDAWRAFSGHLPPSEPKILLHGMCRKLLDLAYDG